ncbi:Phthiotriol/phenolphthiotriol dimycocerosates methyltransferase [bacterium HR15]|nr:Phthiotriol/phenolphthiotriol dimycocerosates methyltransferase [bacterium HR15]
MVKWQEVERIRAVYRRREVMKLTTYNPLDIGAFYLLTSRDRYMIRILRTFLTPTRTLQEIRILDVGCGDGSVLRRLVLLGARPENLCGIDLLEEHIQHAQQVSPNIRFIVGSAEILPFEDESWDLVLMFMIMSSILDSEMQHRVAAEVMRVLKPDGAILWYDFWTNPINPDTIGMTRARIRALFPGHPCKLRRITLAPPIARRLARISWPLCWVLEAIPFLCTHYMGLIYKQ